MSPARCSFWKRHKEMVKSEFLSIKRKMYPLSSASEKETKSYDAQNGMHPYFWIPAAIKSLRYHVCSDVARACYSVTNTIQGTIIMTSACWFKKQVEQYWHIHTLHTPAFINTQPHTSMLQRGKGSMPSLVYIYPHCPRFCQQECIYVIFLNF